MVVKELFVCRGFVVPGFTSLSGAQTQMSMSELMDASKGKSNISWLGSSLYAEVLWCRDSPASLVPRLRCPCQSSWMLPRVRLAFRG
jgi:hypothetical protein